jgi:hypothetical protein
MWVMSENLAKRKLSFSDTGLMASAKIRTLCRTASQLVEIFKFVYQAVIRGYNRLYILGYSLRVLKPIESDLD